MSILTPDYLRSRQQIMPKTESGMYRSQTSPGVYVNYPVSGTFYRRREISEKSPSNGVYIGYRRTWFIPRTQLSVAPNVADIYLAADGNPYTVLKIGTAGGQESWELSTIDLIIAANLKDQVNILAPTNTQDQAGIRVPNYSVAYANLACRFQPIEGGREKNHDKLGFHRFFTVILSQQVSVTTEYQVVSANVPYQIRGFAHPNRIDELMTLTVEKLQ